MKKNLTQYLTILSGILVPAMALAQTAVITPSIPDGVYRGKLHGEDSGRVSLLTQSLPECGGCFLAMLVKDHSQDKQIALYKAMPTNNTDYDLISLEVNNEGEIFSSTKSPSMVLTVLKNSEVENDALIITSANTPNQPGIKGSMIFKNGLSKKNLNTKIKSQGTISLNSNHGALLGDSKSIGGTISLSEKSPGLYTFSHTTHLKNGPAQRKETDKIIVFMKNADRNHAYLINSKDSTDIATLDVEN